jgi:Peptidase family M1 domain
MRQTKRRLLVPSVLALTFLTPLSSEGLKRIDHISGVAPGLALYNVPGTLTASLNRHHDWIKQQGALQLSKRTAPLVPCAAWSGVEVQESAGTLSFDTAAGTVTATTKLTIKSNTNILSTIYLYLEPLSGGTDKVSDASGALQTFDQGNDVLSVSLSKSIDIGDVIVLTMERSGTPKCSTSFLNLTTCQIASSMTFSVGQAWQPMVYDLASYQLLTPKKASLALTVPAGSSAAASGLLAGSPVTNADGTKTFTFTNKYEGVFSFGAADYTYGSATFSGGKKAGTYLYTPAAKKYAAGWQQSIAAIMTFHEARYGSYDPPSISVAEIPNITGAAFGPMLTVFVPGALLAYDPQMTGTTTTLAHELAHQWFGGFIQNGASYSPWISEGFATFAEMEHTSAVATKTYNVDYRPTYRRSKNQYYIYGVPSSADVPMSSQEIYKASSQIYTLVTYYKGALVVGMLRYLLGGDTPFFKAIKAYRTDHADDSATVASLAASLKKASGTDVTAFFKSWVYKAGWPTFKASVDRGGKAGAYTTTVTVKADRDVALPLELELTTADGKKTVKRLTATAGGTEYKLVQQTATEVLSVRVDPQQEIVGRKLGALAGDIHLNGEVDGIDLIYAAMAKGQQFNPKVSQSFADWADLEFDGIINDKDLAAVTSSFGKQTGGK